MNEQQKFTNMIDLAETCPDGLSGESWNFGDNQDVTIGNGRVVILDRSVNVKHLVITDGAMLIFKDGGSNSAVIKLRAMSIKVMEQGALWVGSRSCRYQGLSQ